MTSIDEDYDNSNAPSSADTIPPLQFPSDKAETSKNETALEILQKNSNSSQTKVVTEVKNV